MLASPSVQQRIHQVRGALFERRQDCVGVVPKEDRQRKCRDDEESSLLDQKAMLRLQKICLIIHFCVERKSRTYSGCQFGMPVFDHVNSRNISKLNHSARSIRHGTCGPDENADIPIVPLEGCRAAITSLLVAAIAYFDGLCSVGAVSREPISGRPIWGTCQSTTPTSDSCKAREKQAHRVATKS
jgi:hypothetical protein